MASPMEVPIFRALYLKHDGDRDAMLMDAIALLRGEDERWKEWVSTREEASRWLSKHLGIPTAR